MRMALQVLYFSLICLLLSAEIGQLTTIKENDVKHQNNDTTILLNHFIQHTSSVNLVQRETLNDIPSYILLKEDGIRLLPRTFTICSSASSSIGEIVLFTLLNDDGNQVLNGFFSNEAGNETKSKKESETGFFISGTWISTPSALGVVFPQEWVRSCLALSTKSGLAQGVVEGQLVVNQTFELLTQEGVLPRNLRNRLLLGALQWEDNWYASSTKVSNLNIFSSALSIALCVKGRP